MPRRISDQVLYSTSEAAKELGIHPRTLNRWIKNSTSNSQKKIDHIVDPYNHRIYIRKETVDKMVKETLNSNKG